MATESRSRTDAGFPSQLFSTVRGSFLLSFATGGLALIVLAAVFPYFANPAVAGILAASGIVIFLINVAAHFIYKLLEYVY